MPGIGVLIDGLTTQHWLTIAGLCIAVFIGYFNVTGQLAQRRERKLRTYEATPDVRATINATTYHSGWRSVQLHIAAPADEQNFRLENWHITKARLLRPWITAKLARAANDDYATGVFFPEVPVRMIAGRAAGRPQRFALEFFIKFKQQDDRGRRADFEVTYSHATKPRRRTVRSLCNRSC